MGYKAVKDRLIELDLDRQADRGGAEGLVALCPAHADSHASLHLSEGDNGDALLHCFAGCLVEDVVAYLDLNMSDLFEEPMSERKLAHDYVYQDEQGNNLCRVLRFEPKGFSQQRWDEESKQWEYGLNGVRRVLYRLPAITDASLVYIVEGEKDADALNAHLPDKVIATTTLGGAANFDVTVLESLRDKACVVIPDLDIPGRGHAEKLVANLTGLASSIQVRYPAAGKDVTDHFKAGFKVEDLLDSLPSSESFWLNWEEEGEAVEWLLHPILPKGAYVYVYGPTEASKSIVMQGLGAQLSHQGFRVSYYSLENPEIVDRERLRRLKPDHNHFRISQKPLNLADIVQVDRLVERDTGQDLIVLDTYSHAYNPRKSDDENARAIQFAIVVRRIIKETGATVVVIDHTGYSHEAERGASAKRQQVDMSILMKSVGEWQGKGHPARFLAKNMKVARYANPFSYYGRVTDNLDGSLDISFDTWEVSTKKGEPAETVAEQEPSEISMEDMTVSERLAFIQAERFFNQSEEEQR